MIVNNHQLLSHTYLARLQADPSHGEATAPIAQGLRDWLPCRDASSLQALMDFWVGPVLDFLAFHHAPASAQRWNIEGEHEPNVKPASQVKDGTCGQMITLSVVNENTQYDVSPVSQQKLMEPEYKFVFPQDREGLVVTVRSLLESAVESRLADEAGARELLEGSLREPGDSLKHFILLPRRSLTVTRVLDGT